MLIGLEDVLAFEELGAGQEAPVPAHRVVDGQAIAAADDIVLQAVTGGGMNGAGARVQGHMLAQDHRDLAVIEGVPEHDPLQVLAEPVPHDPVVLEAPAVHGVLEQALGDNQPFLLTGGLHLDDHIFEFRVQGNRLVGGQGPGGRGPDDQRRRAIPAAIGRPVAARCQSLRLRQREAHVDGDRLLIGVFDLRLGQGRTAVNTPVHRLLALDHMTVGDDAPE